MCMLPKVEHWDEEQEQQQEERRGAQVCLQEEGNQGQISSGGHCLDTG